MAMALVTEEPESAFTLTPNGMGYEVIVDTDDWFLKEQKLHFVRFLPEGAERPKAEDSPFFKKAEDEDV